MTYKGYKLEALHGNALHMTYDPANVIWHVLDPNNIESWSFEPALVGSFSSEAECKAWIDEVTQ